MKKFCAVIPSLNPDERLLDVVNGLKEKEFYKIIIVNDGSSSDKYFSELKDGCDILTHYKNYGKGRAMKTALNYYMNTYSDVCLGVVFADSDNQHDTEDICRCCEELYDNPDSLILGSRDFNQSNVPSRSRFGNKTTSFVFKSLCGIDISDTQTGLRAMGNSVIPYFLDLFGERFEYETNMLLECKKQNIPIREVPIKTVYIDGNKSSHFNPLTDSAAIYKLIIKYAWSSLMSFVIDIALFSLCLVVFKKLPDKTLLLFSTVVSRILSSLFNYAVNHKVVFRCKEHMGRTLLKYYVLCLIQMGASYGGVYLLTSILGISSVIIKIIVDTVLWLISFRIQHSWVFKNSIKR